MIGGTPLDPCIHQANSQAPPGSILYNPTQRETRSLVVSFLASAGQYRENTYIYIYTHIYMLNIDILKRMETFSK